MMSELAVGINVVGKYVNEGQGRGWTGNGHQLSQVPKQKVGEY